MPFLWWFLIIAAALGLMLYLFGRNPERVDGTPLDEGAVRGPNNDAAFFRDGGHGNAEFAEEIAPHGERFDAYNPNPGGPAKVGESPDLWPDRTGADTAEALGARVPPAGERREEVEAAGGRPAHELLLGDDARRPAERSASNPALTAAAAEPGPAERAMDGAIRAGANVAYPGSDLVQGGVPAAHAGANTLSSDLDTVNAHSGMTAREEAELERPLQLAVGPEGDEGIITGQGGADAETGAVTLDAGAPEHSGPGQPRKATPPEYANTGVRDDHPLAVMYGNLGTDPQGGPTALSSESRKLRSDGRMGAAPPVLGPDD